VVTSKSASAQGCPFCSIAAGLSPAHRVLEWDLCVAFLDQRPVFLGHVLVVPRAHRPTMADVTPAELDAIFGAAQSICAAAPRALDADGSFVAVNDRVSQSVPHVHVHVVPRRKGDGLRGFFWPRLRYASIEQAEEIAAKLRTALVAQRVV
jgi:histidine triad (HIT) family protein